MTRLDDTLRAMMALERKIDAVEDAPDHDVKVWVQGYHDCLVGVIALLGGDVDET